MSRLRDVAALGDAVSAVLDASGTIDHVLRQLGELVPFDAAMLSSFDVLGSGHRTLARAGYDDVVANFANGDYARCPSFAASLQSREPMRMRDYAFDFRSLPTFTEVLRPAGFQEGMTTILRRAGTTQHVGILVLSHRDPGGVGDHEREVVQAIAPMLARLADDRGRRYLARPTHGAAVPVAIVDRKGTVHPLDTTGEALSATAPGLGPAAAVLLASDRLARSGFVEMAGRWWRVHMTRVDDLSLPDPEVVLLLAEERNLPLRLTSRELEVLTLLSDGQSNAQIADCLVLSVRTVTTHVEHLFGKLKCSSRAGCAARAEADGLRLIR